MTWAPAVHADDWPEWRGPRRDGISAEKGWLDAWPSGKNPTVAWRIQVGKGHSAISVSQGRAFTMGWDGRDDTVYCLDPATGKVLWRRAYPCPTIKQWPGPRSTPTVFGGRVYTLSQHGLLHALDAATGNVVWKIQLAATYNPDVDYGFAWSPLIEGEHLILGCGERGLAIRTKDGSFAWGNDGKPGACASPVRYDQDGRRIVVLLANDRGENVHVIGVNPSDGKELWRSPPWPEKWGAACVDPVVRDGSIFLTTAERHIVGGRFTVKDGKVQLDWTQRRLACYTGSCILLGDLLFGASKDGALKCVDWKTGQEKWAERGFDGHVPLTAADGKLIAQTSKRGELVVIEPAPNAYNQLRRAKVFEGEPATFTVPVVSNGRIYCRSYAGEVVCLVTGNPSR